MPLTALTTPTVTPAARERSEGGVPLVLLQHFRGNLDNWDPALIDALAVDAEGRHLRQRRGGRLHWQHPRHRRADGPRRDGLPRAMSLDQVDLLGFSIGSFVAQEIALTRPATVSKAGAGVVGASGRGRYARLGAGSDRRGRHAADQPGGIPERVLRPVSYQQASGPEALQAHVRSDRGPGRVTSWATREAQYDAVCAWGMPDQALLERLSGLRCRCS